MRSPGPRVPNTPPTQRTALIAILALALHLLSGCAMTGGNPYAGPLPTRPVWLVAPGWHTGLAVRRSDLPKELIPESADFPDADYLEIGWGDRDYYQATQPSLWQALKAALIPGPSVLHVAGFVEPPARYFGPETTLRIDLPDAPFRNMLGHIHASFVRHGASRAMALAPGLYGDSRFYEAHGRFHLFNNCNSWAAQALRTAGLPVVPALALTAGNLRRQARSWATTAIDGQKGFESKSTRRYTIAPH